MATEVVLVDRLVEVPEDGVAGRDGLVGRPRLERVRVGLEIGVGAHAGIAEEIPRPTECVARLEHRERDVGERVAKVPGGADAGHAGTDDHHVELLRVAIHWSTPLRRPGRPATTALRLLHEGGG
jgi:hypothetical protein